MASSSNMKINVIAVDKASKTLGGIGKSMKGLAGTAAGVATGIGLEKAAEKIISFGQEAITKFQNTGTEVIKMQRLIGGSVEDTSRLAASFAALGIDSDKSTRFISRFSNGMGKNAKMLEGMGVATKDASGKTKSFSEMLPNIADVFKKMPNGIEKTALAQKLFGRGSADMLKLLNKGSDGLKKMGEESDKLGTTMGQKDIDAIQKNIVAKRKFNETMKGAAITVGRVLYPILTLFVELMNKYVAPAIKWASDKFVILGQKIKDFFGGPAAGQIKSMGDKFNVFKESIKKVWDIFRQLILPKIFPLLKTAFQDISSFIQTVFVPIFGALYDAISAQLVPTFQALVDYFNNAVKPVFEDVWGIIQKNVLPLYKTLSGFISKTLIPAFSAIWSVFIQKILPAFTGLVNVIRIFVMPVLATIIDAIRTKLVPVFQAIVDAVIKNVLPAVSSLFDKFNKDALPVLKRLAGILAVVISWLVRVAGSIIKTVLPPLIHFIGPILGALIRVLGWVIGAVFKAIGWVLDLGKTFKTVLGKVKEFVDSGKTKLGQIIEFIKKLPGKITDGAKGLWEGLKNGLSSAVDWIKGKINDVIGLFNKPIQWINDHNGPLPDVPSIPYLASGGIVTRPTIAMIGEAGPEAVIPLGRLGAGGGGTQIIIQGGTFIGASKQDTARWMSEIIREGKSRGLVMS